MNIEWWNKFLEEFKDDEYENIIEPYTYLSVSKVLDALDDIFIIMDDVLFQDKLDYVLEQMEDKYECN